MRFALAVAGMALLMGVTGTAQAADPFARPVKDCRPCRFSPGAGQPAFDLTFVFSGSSDEKALTGLDLRQVGTSQTQHLAVDSLSVSDFSEGFTLDTADMNFDGLHDLSIITQVAADNVDAAYWIYRPQSHDLVPLERVNDGDDNGVTLSPADDHMLSCHVKDNAVYATDYLYRVSGHRAVAVRKKTREQDGALVVDASYDLSVTPNKRLKRTIVGFVEDSPERRAFTAELAVASRQARMLYRKGNAGAAAAAIALVVGDKELALVTTAYPVTGDPGDARLVGDFNDYGFYLQQAGRAKDAIGVLSAVVDVEPSRTVAYLNLADAEYAAGRQADAKTHYTQYAKRMQSAGKQAAMPPRVAERMR